MRLVILLYLSFQLMDIMSKDNRFFGEEDKSEFVLTAEMKSILEKRLQDPDEDYITGEESIEMLKEKYGL